MNNFTIDDPFIAKWHSRYDEIEHDEEEYQKIIEQVKVDIADGGTISYETTKRLLKWKKARRATNFILDSFAKFDEAIRKGRKEPECTKLQILDDLPGIGVPVGSTFLHFMYPDKFLIMDVRTVEVLYTSGYIKFKSRDAKRYLAFRDVIFSIHRQSPGWNLRQIDRALFAFHKIELSKKHKNC
jgi:thermostable 8-oxoguanine DNA glycosylase